MVETHNTTISTSIDKIIVLCSNNIMQKNSSYNSPLNILQKNSFDLSHGFLPNAAPLTKLPKPFAAWDKFAYELPKILANQAIHELLHKLPDFPLDQLSSGDEYERAMVILSFIAHAYVWENQQAPATSLPALLAKPWHAVATQLGRPPILSYASYALYNWYLLNPDKPIELGNIGLLQNFLGGMDEEWFILIHIDIEARATQALTQLIPLLEAAKQKDSNTLQACLSEIKNSLTAMNETLERTPERCDPYIYYQRVRPYIHGWKANPALPDGLIYDGVEEYKNQPQQFKGETGAQSTIIPAIDAALGVMHADSPLHQHLLEMQRYMPPSHRDFLKHLQAQVPLRTYLTDKVIDSPVIKSLFNDCVSLIHRFRDTHIGFAANYIQRQSQSSLANTNEVGTGGTPFMRYLAAHRDETSGI